MEMTRLNMQGAGEEEVAPGKRRRLPGTADAQAASTAAAATAAEAAGPSTSAAAQAAAAAPKLEDVVRCMQQVLSRTVGQDRLAIARSVRELLQVRSDMIVDMNQHVCPSRHAAEAGCPHMPLSVAPAGAVPARLTGAHPLPALDCCTPQVCEGLFLLEREGKARRHEVKPGSRKPLWWAAA